MVGSSPVHCRMFGGIAGHYPLVASGSPSPQAVTTKTVSDNANYQHEGESANCFSYPNHCPKETEL